MKSMRVVWRTFAVLAVGWAVALPLAADARISAPPGTWARRASALVYAAGAGICHQRPERSFHLAGAPLPVCARCTGIYAGAAVAVLALAVTAVRRTPRGSGSPTYQSSAATHRALAVSSLLPGAATLAYEWSSGTMPLDLVRAASGVPIGVVAAWLVLAATRTDALSE